MITVIIVLVIIAAVAVFSVQNAIPVGITVLSWKFEASLAIIVFLSVLAGMIIGVIGVSLLRMKMSRKRQETTDLKKAEKDEPRLP